MNDMMGGSSDEEDEQDMQNRLLRGLFGVGDETGVDDDDDELVSKHTWTLPDEEVSLVYHLAFLAPGHGDALWNSAESIAEHILVRDLRKELFGESTGLREDASSLGREPRCRVSL